MRSRRKIEAGQSRKKIKTIIEELTKCTLASRQESLSETDSLKRGHQLPSDEKGVEEKHLNATLPIIFEQEKSFSTLSFIKKKCSGIRV